MVTTFVDGAVIGELGRPERVVGQHDAPGADGRGWRRGVKVTVPHDEARSEVVALDTWNGDGAVRLLRANDDGFTLLLGRCRPGHDLWRVPGA